VGILQFWDSSLLWAPFEPSYRKAKHFSVFSLCGYGQAALGTSSRVLVIRHYL
jgi:hypothetical protein